VRQSTGASDTDSSIWHTVASVPAEMERVARAAWPGGHEPPAGLALIDAVIYPGSGVAFLLDSTTPSEFIRMRASAEAAHGALIVERADPAFKAAVGGAWGRPRVPLAIARALKQKFDPRGVLAPGRIPLASSS
jgi:hypothetical protein